MSQPDASMPPAPRLAEPRIVRGSAALRALAAAFAHLQDFDGFVRGLQTALDQTEWFGRVTIELADRPGAGEAQFLIGEMTLPVQGATGAHGLLRAAGREEEAATRFLEGAADASSFTRYLNRSAQHDPPLPR